MSGFKGDRQGFGVILSLRQAAVLILLSLIIVLPRAAVVGRSITVDEPTWLARSSNFYHALERRDFTETYRSEHPGVTVMWVGAAAQRLASSEVAIVDWITVQLRVYDGLLEAGDRATIDLLALSRLLMALANTAVLILAFLYARRLMGALPALTGFLLIALDPFFMAHTHLLHLDGLLSSLMLLSLLAYISFILQCRCPCCAARRLRHLAVGCRRSSCRWRHLLVSGIAAGLSWLTKLPGLFLVPAIALLVLWDWRQRGPEDRGWVRQAAVKIAPAMIWGIIAVVTFTAFWPAMWRAPQETLWRMFEETVPYAGGHENPVFFAGRIVDDGDVGPTFYPVAYLWRTTPIVLAGLLAAAAACLLRRQTPASNAIPSAAEGELRFTLAGLLLFALLFGLQVTLSAKKGDRYLLPVHPPLTLIAAMGWSMLAYWLAERWPTARRLVPTLVLGAVLALQAATSAQVFPTYLSYYNPLLGGPQAAMEVLTVGWGEGLDQAAIYLNHKPDAAHLRVAAWYMPSFSYFFKGRSMPIDSAIDISRERLRRLRQADYLVIYIHQWQRQTPKPLLDYLKTQTPEHTIRINELDYVQIYRLSSTIRTSPRP